MKHFILSIAISFISFTINAQETANSKILDTATQHKRLKPLRLIDGQILGPGIFFSVNYDERFKPSNKGFGCRAGLGYALGATIPLSINYLIGNNNKRSSF